ncbi:hypothetical protein AB0L62_07715 [Nocardia asteroides]|uniref:hypothetical protein n=1 Tax=Nocardia asteroides TaxID=1824 RepID=UPI00341EB9FF
MAASPRDDSDGEQERTLAATDRVDAFIDAAGGGRYIDLSINLCVTIDQIDTSVYYRGAKERGVKSLGTADAGGRPVSAALAATGELHIPSRRRTTLNCRRPAHRSVVPLRRAPSTTPRPSTS